MSALSDEFKVKIQYFMPKKLLSRAVGKLAAAEMGQGTAFLIERFIRYYNVDMKDAKIQDIAKFKSFNDFFTRELKKNARPVVSDENALAEPADGTISELGEIYKDAVLQAKGHYYSLEALLGGNREDAAYFENGSFATTYLSPRDYHRVHMPLDGKLEKMLFIPGELFSVNPLTARNVDNLFARNERVVCFSITKKSAVLPSFWSVRQSLPALRRYLPVWLRRPPERKLPFTTMPKITSFWPKVPNLGVFCSAVR